MRLGALFLTVLVVGALPAQPPGSLDMSFAANDLGHAIGDGPGTQVNTVAVLADGKVLVGTALTSTFDGVPRTTLYSLNGNGTLDLSFGSAATINGPVYSIVEQPDGKVIVGGSFTDFQGTVSSRLARTLADGTYDPAFNIGTGFNGSIRRIIRMADGRILVAGAFTTFNGTARNRVARLNADGSVDATFSTGTGPNGTVYDMALLPNGQIVICGTFTSVSGSARNRVAMLNSNGALFTGFNPAGTGPNGSVDCVAALGTNRILLGGIFNQYNGATAGGIVKVDYTGARDATFDSDPGFFGQVRDLAVQPDGKVLAGGTLNEFNGTAVNDVARLSGSGVLDPTFAAVPEVSTEVYDIALRPDGRLVLATIFGDEGQRGVQQLGADGHSDLAFGTGTGFNRDVNAQVRSIALASNGQILVSGQYTRAWNRFARGAVMVDGASGERDLTYVPAVSTTDDDRLLLQPDGKLLVYGTPLSIGLPALNNLVRLLPDGSRDPGFISGSGFNGAVLAVALQPDGKIIAAGNFTQFNGVPCSRVVRLHPDGSLDNTYQTGTAASSLMDAVVQPDGLVVLVGNFTSFNGVPRSYVVRLLSDGSVDPSFVPAPGPNSWPAQILCRPDGRLLIRGFFSTVDGQPRSGLAQLLPDGSLDPSFVPEAGSANPEMLLQPNGKLLVIGPGNQTVVRLLTNGKLDPTFTCTTNGQVHALAQQPDGKIVVGGAFTVCNGVGRNRLARVHGGDPVVSVNVKVLLDGPYDNVTGWMNDGLRAFALIPNDEPYTAMGFAQLDPQETVATTTWLTTGPDAIVDWVLVELRSDTGTVVTARAGLLQRDGDVVATDGVSPLEFTATHAALLVAVHHRNHLGAMTAFTYQLNNTPTVIDFGDPALPVHGTDARKPVGARMVLWAGNTTGDAEVKYTGPGNDRDPILVVIGGSVPTNSTTGYLMEDVNLDGTVKYTGTANDRDPILVNIGGTVPTSVRTEQLP